MSKKKTNLVICTVVINPPQKYSAEEYKLVLIKKYVAPSSNSPYNARLPFLYFETAVVCKLELSRGVLTRYHGVLGHGLNIHWNIPLIISYVLL